MRKVTAIIMVFLLMGTLFLVFTSGNTLAQPAIVCTDPNTETTMGQTFTKNYFVYYDENVSQGRIYVETYILFKNVNPNTTTFFQVKGGDTFHSGSHLNQTGWYTHLELSEGGTLFMDFGYFSNDSASDQTDPNTLTLSIYREYMLKVTVYAPQNLSIGHKYTANIEIDAWENATLVDSIEFKATITPTLDYYVFGTVYMSDGSPAEFASLNITNKNIGGSRTGFTDKNGEYFLRITDIGYHEGDIIQVDAVKGDEKGSASTVVSIVPPFRQDFLGSECDVSIMLVYEVSLFPTPETIEVGDTITFNASHYNIKYYFDFGDGTNSGWRNDPVVSHVFLTSGTYNVSLKVRDNDIESNNIANVTITVTTDQSSEPEGFIPFLGMEIVILCIFGSAMLLKYKRKRR